MQYIMNELPILKDRINTVKKRHDCDESYLVEYKFNDFGYRASFDYKDLLKKPKIVCIGCSFTEGVGLYEEETWPFLLSQKMGLPFFNLGIVSKIFKIALGKTGSTKLFLVKPSASFCESIVLIIFSVCFLFSNLPLKPK